MSRVSAIALAQIDLRIVLFAMLIAAGTAFTSLQILARARECRGNERTAWLLLAGAVAAAGIWSTHFLTVRAYTWDVATAYNLLAVAATLLAATIATTAGLALAAPEGRWQAAAGGALIGLGIVVTHVVGVKMLDVPATLHRNVPVAMLVNVLAVALCCAAMMAQRELRHRWMPLAASGLLALTICGFHLAALGMLGVTPDPALAQTVSDISGTTLTIVVACTTGFIMVVAHIATHIAAQLSRETALDLRRRHEVLQLREEELSRQNVRFDMALTSLPHGLVMVDAERRLVVCNKRYADIYGIPSELTKPGTHFSALVDHRLANLIFSPHDAEVFRNEALALLWQIFFSGCGEGIHESAFQ